MSKSVLDRFAKDLIKQLSRTSLDILFIKFPRAIYPSFLSSTPITLLRIPILRPNRQYKASAAKMAYRKVANCNLSWLVARFQIFRRENLMLMYCDLWPESSKIE